MDSRLIREANGQRTFVLVFRTGDEAMDGLSAFVREHRIGAAQLTGIGAFSDVELGYFDWQSKEYRPIPVDEQVELVSLGGDVALDGEQPVVHSHWSPARSWCVDVGADGAVFERRTREHTRGSKTKEDEWDSTPSRTSCTTR